MTCPWPDKRTFGTRKLARAGAETIRTVVTARGGIFQTLYPYPCPHEDHWHLSHYRQGYAGCPECWQRKPAWYSGSIWVMGRHDHEGERCNGEGKPSYTTGLED